VTEIEQIRLQYTWEQGFGNALKIILRSVQELLGNDARDEVWADLKARGDIESAYEKFTSHTELFKGGHNGETAKEYAASLGITQGTRDVLSQRKKRGGRGKAS